MSKDFGIFCRTCFKKERLSNSDARWRDFTVIPDGTKEDLANEMLNQIKKLAQFEELLHVIKYDSYPIWEIMSFNHVNTMSEWLKFAYKHSDHELILCDEDCVYDYSHFLT